MQTAHDRTSAPKGVVWGIAAATCLGLSALVLGAERPPSVDDAFITLVYARHFASHGAFYWNAADGAVDGFTSLLDVVLKAVAIRLAPSDPIRDGHVVVLAGYFATTALGAIVARVASRPTVGSRAIALVAALACATNVTFAYATSFGLEASLHAGLALAGFLFVGLAAPRTRVGRLALGLALVLLVLARPEGIPLAALFAGGFAVDGPRPAMLRARVEPAAVLAVGTVAFLVWHGVAFGWLAPNTFYAKSSASRLAEIGDGIAYVRAFLVTPAGALAAASAITLGLLGSARRYWLDERQRRATILGLSAFALTVVEVVVEGGDNYDGARFLAVPMVLLLATLAVAAQGLSSRTAIAPVVGLAAFVLIGGAFVVEHARDALVAIARWPEGASRYACDAGISRFIADRATRVGETDDQRLKYFADDLEVVDLMGLNDARIAHRAEEGHVRWGKGGMRAARGLDLDALLLGSRVFARTPITAVPVATLADDPALGVRFLGDPVEPEIRDMLVGDYVPVSLAACGVYVNFFARADVAARFAETATVTGR